STSPVGAGGGASSRSGWLGRGCGCVSAAAGHAEIESAATRTRAPRSPGLCRLLIGQVPEVHAQRDVIAGDDLRVLDEGTEAPAPDRPNDRVVLEPGRVRLRDAHVG